MNKILIVAELSANHNGKKEIAIETIKAAKRAGADAIKLQTYTADTITIDCRNKDFYIPSGLGITKEEVNMVIEDVLSVF